MTTDRRTGPSEGAGHRSEPGRRETDTEHTTPALFDPEAIREPQWTDELHDLDGRRRQRQEAALNAAARSWRRDAERTIEQLAQSGRDFTSDDLYRYVGPVMGPSTNVVGALFSAAARRGIIRRVGYRRSEREEAAGRVVAIWRGTGGACD